MPRRRQSMSELHALFFCNWQKYILRLNSQSKSYKEIIMAKLQLKTIALLISSGLMFTVPGFAQDTPTAPDEASSVTVEATAQDDAAIETAIKNVLSSVSNVAVSVQNGVAYLSGELNSETDYESVVTLAQATPGVKEVNADKLTVKDSQSPLADTLITAKVKGAILKSDLLGKDIPTWSVHVETKDGIVYLSGEIPTLEEKQNILEVVKSVKGITDIKDALVVTNN